MLGRFPRCGAVMRAVVVLAVALFSVVLALPAGAEEGSRTTGQPTSSNGASSSQLAINRPPSIRAAAAFNVVQPPRDGSLHFWALQVSFLDRAGRVVGGAHLGLQWHTGHPGSTAVNFGGYDRAGRELAGSASALPSATGNPNTRDFAWQPRVTYRLSIARARDGWIGRVTERATGRVTDVRTLYIDAATVGHPTVFAEVFARCDAPQTTVRWSDLGSTSAVANYQSYDDGGCTNRDQRADGDGIVQATTSARTLTGGTILTYRSSSSGGIKTWTAAR